MAARISKPKWRLPPGVTRGLWDYAQSARIANDYDTYFSENTLFEFDEALLRRHFREPGVLFDLGCGTGRLLIPFARLGFHGVAVDLSSRMLEVVGEKARRENLAIDRMAVNFAEMDAVRDGVADYCICMFSTLGMIQGRQNRLSALRHIRRILKPGGLFALHVHNRWYNLFDPQGRRWVVRNLLAARFRRNIEPGDKYFDYRGIPNMFLHVFTRHELARDLRRAGFHVREWTLLDTARRHALRSPWFLGRLRANGWIVVCE